MGVLLTQYGEHVMAKSSREMSYRACAFCGAPLAFNSAGVVAWRVGNQFVCNEFCAEGVPSGLTPSGLTPMGLTAPQAMPPGGRSKQPFSLN
jgi:hypothetical protein